MIPCTLIGQDLHCMVNKSIDHRNDVMVAQFVLSGFPHEHYFPRIMSTEMNVNNTFHGLSLIDHRNNVPFNVYFADFSAKQPIKSTLQKGEESDTCTAICGTT